MIRSPPISMHTRVAHPPYKASIDTESPDHVEVTTKTHDSLILSALSIPLRVENPWTEIEPVLADNGEMVNAVSMAIHTTHSWMVPPVVATHWVRDSGLGSPRLLEIVVLSCRFHARNTHELATWYDPRPCRCTLASHIHHTRPPLIQSRPTTSR